MSLHDGGDLIDFSYHIPMHHGLIQYEYSTRTAWLVGPGRGDDMG